MKALRGIYLQSNALEGTIPAQFGDLENLSRLLLADNRLEGRFHPN